MENPSDRHVVRSVIANRTDRKLLVFLEDRYSSNIVSIPLIRVEELRKTYRQGFWMRRVEAVGGVSFQVKEGQSFGFLGPNGAGKTTTIKILMGLIGATSGEASLFGLMAPDRRTRQKVGFMPENPYVYPYLSPREFVKLCGRLSGLRGGALASRTEAVLNQTGIAYAATRQVRHLSKGMLQRTGLAAALVADPELLVLDEPMSGLDPGGRREVRDIILQERAAGRTIFFSTHILTDVPELCENIAILQRGKLVVSGRIDELLKKEATHIDVVVELGAAELRERWENEGVTTGEKGGQLTLTARSEEVANAILGDALARGTRVIEVSPRYDSLEELFLRKAQRNVPASPEKRFRT